MTSKRRGVFRALALGGALTAGVASGQGGIYVVGQSMGPYSSNTAISSSSTVEYRNSPTGPPNYNVSVFHGVRILEDGVWNLPPTGSPGNQCGQEGTNTQAGRVTTTAQCYGTAYQCYASYPRVIFLISGDLVVAALPSYGRQCIVQQSGGGGSTCPPPPDPDPEHPGTPPQEYQDPNECLDPDAPPYQCCGSPVVVNPELLT